MEYSSEKVIVSQLVNKFTVFYGKFGNKSLETLIIIVSLCQCNILFCDVQVDTFRYGNSKVF
jgi:hypothetical protein